MGYCSQVITPRLNKKQISKSYVNAGQMNEELGMRNENAIEAKSFDFAIRIVKLYQYLTNEKKEFVLSKQLLRSGTSIGANVAEAERAQSQADFYAKMSIALKEANETDYWLRLLYKTDYLTENEYNSINKNINEIIALLVSITKTVKSSLETERRKE